MPNGMILAAGRGTRLGPLTSQMPKPLLPVANQPVMARGIATLRALDITRICSNLCYRADQIQAVFGDGAAHDVTLRWEVECAPRGTAGGMKRLQRHLDDDLVVVIAGDAMLDVDLAPLLAAHRATGAFASLGTLAVDDPSLYGVVVADPDGRIRSFQEKPAPGQEISHQANTGIYVFDPGIFDLISTEEVCDFALHVFPEILRRGLPFYAFPLNGYWTDIGNPGDYLQANLDFLAGRIRAGGAGRRMGASFVADDLDLAGVMLDACVVGAGAVLPPGTALTRCVVWPGTVLAAPQTLASAVLTPWGAYAVAGKHAHELAPAG